MVVLKLGKKQLGFDRSIDRSSEMDAEFWIAGGISVFLVVFAGIMSGLTLGLMSLGLVDLQVLQQSGSEDEKKQASKCRSVSTVSSSNTNSDGFSMCIIWCLQLLSSLLCKSSTSSSSHCCSVMQQPWRY